MSSCRTTRTSRKDTHTHILPDTAKPSTIKFKFKKYGICICVGRYSTAYTRVHGYNRIRCPLALRRLPTFFTNRRTTLKARRSCAGDTDLGPARARRLHAPLCAILHVVHPCQMAIAPPQAPLWPDGNIVDVYHFVVVSLVSLLLTHI
jgi:hypothetical protein